MDAFLVFEDEKYDHMPGRSTLLDIAREEDSSVYDYCVWGHGLDCGI
jgi:hypothetical protein